MTYYPDYEGIDHYLNEDPDLRECLEQRGRVALAAIVAAAPKVTGRFASSGRVVFDGPHQGVAHDRMSVSVVFDDPAATAIIFGTSDTPSHMGMIEQAIAAVGSPGHSEVSHPDLRAQLKAQGFSDEIITRAEARVAATHDRRSAAAKAAWARRRGGG